MIKIFLKTIITDYVKNIYSFQGLYQLLITGGVNFAYHVYLVNHLLMKIRKPVFFCMYSKPMVLKKFILMSHI